MDQKQVSARAFLEALNVLESKTAKNIDGYQMTALMHLYNAGSEGLSMGEVAKSVGVSQVSGGRMVSVLSCGAKDSKSSGWKLVEVRRDPNRPRCNIAKLNEEGRALVNGFLGALTEAGMKSQQ